MDLKDNEIENTCADELLDLIQKNYLIEDIVIHGNHFVDMAKKEQI